MATDVRHPLERAADGALAKAEAMGGHAAARWNPDSEDWSVHSATDPGTVYRVWRKHPDGPATEQTERQQQANRGWWWFTLECNCPAIASSGYAVCKHKACVRLWQLHYQRRDGRAWGTLPAHSNAMAQANEALDPDGVETWKDKEAETDGDPFSPDDSLEAPSGRYYDGVWYDDLPEGLRRYAADPPSYADAGNQEKLPW